MIQYLFKNYKNNSPTNGWAVIVWSWAKDLNQGPPGYEQVSLNEFEISGAV